MRGCSERAGEALEGNPTGCSRAGHSEALFLSRRSLQDRRTGSVQGTHPLSPKMMTFNSVRLRELDICALRSATALQGRPKECGCIVTR